MSIFGFQVPVGLAKVPLTWLHQLPDWPRTAGKEMDVTLQLFQDSRSSYQEHMPVLNDGLINHLKLRLPLLQEHFASNT